MGALLTPKFTALHIQFQTQVQIKLQTFFHNKNLQAWLARLRYLGDRANTGSESMVSSAELSEFFGPHQVRGVGVVHILLYTTPLKIPLLHRKAVVVVVYDWWSPINIVF